MKNNENKTAFVTKKLIECNFNIGYAYREKPDTDIDSGWRFFVGDETDEYVNNPDNLTLMPIKNILENCEDLLTIIDSEYETAFEKNNGVFKRIEDFKSN